MDKLLVEYQPALTGLLFSKLPAHGTIQSVERNKSTIIKDDSNLVQLYAPSFDLSFSSRDIEFLVFLNS